MENSGEPGLFKNDGSFLERFKQLQQEQEAAKLSSKSDILEATSTSGSHHFNTTTKTTSSLQNNSVPKGGAPKPSVLTNGKLAFSLKQKSRLAVSALKLGGDDDEEPEAGLVEVDRRAKRLKLERVPGSSGSLSEQGQHAAPPAPPADLEVKKVADKLASFVAKNGRQFENITRQKNPGDTSFRFLFDVNCSDYKYYEFRIAQEEQVLAGLDSQANQSGGAPNILPRQQSSQQKGGSQSRTNYQTPASALYNGSDDQWRQHKEQTPTQEYAGYSSMTSDSVAMMEFYMKKAAQEDLRKPPKQSKDEMPPPASLLPPEKISRHHSPVIWTEDVPAESGPPYLSPTKGLDDVAQGLVKKGHHMGDYIPPEELEKFLAKCNDAMAQKAAKATADRAKIQADNVGHRLLSKMGWKEGEGLGSRKGGRADPVQAGAVKLNNLGVGAEQPGEVTPDDDIYEQYKKRMMLGYRFRPNPLNNPRKAYY